MFSKHVWYDRKHQAEVFITDEGVISGTIVAYEGAISVINPRPEVLLALYQEAKIKRILGVKAVILTSDSIDFTRGLCAFVNYSRGLRRRSPLTIIARSDSRVSPDFLSRVSPDFLSSCCARLWGDSQFDVQFAHLRPGDEFALGKGRLRFDRTSDDESPHLVMHTEKDRTLHYYDESHSETFAHAADTAGEKPNLVIRAADLPGYLKSVRRRLEAAE
jgi:hypothetical protein